MDPIYLNALNLVLGPHRIPSLIRKFGSIKDIWKTIPHGLDNVSSQQKLALIERKKSINPQEQWKKLEHLGISFITTKQADYPRLLKETSSSPIGIYLKGNRSILSQDSIAVVGTRSPSSYGKTITPFIVKDLVQSGLVVVSGLAQGIDAIAHITAIQAAGKTVAVLGCGIGQVFPLLNRPLAERILKSNSAIISEYPLGMPPLKQHFPARNRIIAGLSKGVVIIESRAKGGALITAYQALEENREVFALPGPINSPTSEGTNNLIQRGAKLITKSQDILEEINLERINRPSKTEALSKEEIFIINLVSVEPLHIDTVIKQAKLKPSQVNALLTSLELKGAIKNMGGNVYMKVI